MAHDQAVEILKRALLLEKRGMAFYRQVAAQASHPAVRQFFEIMAEEEVRHVEILSAQFRAYQQSGRFTPVAAVDETGEAAVARVITPALIAAMQAADYEGAAISAAVGMEKNAVALYAERARQTSDPEEKTLYDWLSRWEQTHLTFLADLDRELTEKIWSDQNFWPF
jgi:rubrerythrin